MSNVEIIGGTHLHGTVKVSGAKNAAIPLLCASLLARGKVLFRNMPKITDVDSLVRILKYLECDVKFKGHTMLVDNTNLKYKPLLLTECKQMRGSYYLMGVFLTLFSKCEMVLPGGCKIGKRPIDIHLQAFKEMGFQYVINEDVISIVKHEDIKNLEITLKNKSVGASLNAMFAGLSIDNLTLRNTLFEPEGRDVLLFLRQIGYDVHLQEDVLVHKTKKLELKLIKHNVLPDRVEAMTYTILGLLTGKLRIQNVATKDIELPLKLLEESDYAIKYNSNEIIVNKSKGNGMRIKTEVYPGFPTDMQPIFGVLCAYSKATSIIEETIFENRLQIYHDLKDLGVDVNIETSTITIQGQSEIECTKLTACDLRQGVALALLAFAAKGTVQIENFEYIERGYEDFIHKVTAIGGKIKQYDVLPLQNK